jgi:hypothetical protein
MKKIFFLCLITLVGLSDIHCMSSKKSQIISILKSTIEKVSDKARLRMFTVQSFFEYLRHPETSEEFFSLKDIEKWFTDDKKHESLNLFFELREKDSENFKWNGGDGLDNG